MTWSNPLYRCVDVTRLTAERATVVERHRITGHYRERTVDL